MSQSALSTGLANFRSMCQSTLNTMSEFVSGEASLPCSYSPAPRAQWAHRLRGSSQPLPRWFSRGSTRKRRCPERQTTVLPDQTTSASSFSPTPALLLLHNMLLSRRPDAHHGLHPPTDFAGSAGPGPTGSMHPARASTEDQTPGRQEKLSSQVSCDSGETNFQKAFLQCQARSVPPSLPPSLPHSLTHSPTHFITLVYTHFILEPFITLVHTSHSDSLRPFETSAHGVCWRITRYNLV